MKRAAAKKPAKAAGRPFAYTDDDIERRVGAVAGWKRRGLTDVQVAEQLGISISTLQVYANKYPELKTALKAGREESIVEVENSLHKQAMAGNIAAIIFYLKNRKSSDWRDKQEIEHSGEILTKEKIEERQKSGWAKFFGGTG